MTNTLDKLLNTFILLTLFITPLVGASSTRGYEEIKVILFLNLFLVIAIIFILQIYRKQIILKKTPILLLVGALVGWLGITSLIGLNIQRSLFGVFPYYQGWIVYLFFALFYLTIAVSKNSLERKICWTLLASSTTVAVIAILQTVMLYTGVSVVTYASRVVSTFGQPNFYAGFIFLTFSFWFYLWQTKINKSQIRILLTLFLINCVGIVLSRSRTAIILTGLLIIVYFLRRFLVSRLSKLSVIFLTIFILGFGIYNSGMFYAEFYRPLTIDYWSHVEGNTQRRLYFYQAALALASRSPILGFGLENIDYAIPKIYDFNHPTPPFYHEFKDMTINRTHNYLLDLQLFGGSVALLLFLVILFVAFKQARFYQRVFLISFILWSSLQNLSVIHLLLLFVTLGQIAHLTIDSKSSNKVRLQ